MTRRGFFRTEVGPDALIRVTTFVSLWGMSFRVGDNPLIRQLDEQRFLHAISYVEQEAGGLKKLHTSELARINKYLSGEEEDEEPWRIQATSVRIPSGQTLHFNVINNPVHGARDVLSEAQRIAVDEDVVEAALYVYSQLVLHHFFNEANRRTAMLAALWVVRAQKRSLDIVTLGKGRIGDLRDNDAMDELRKTLKTLIR